MALYRLWLHHMLLIGRLTRIRDSLRRYVRRDIENFNASLKVTANCILRFSESI